MGKDSIALLPFANVHKTFGANGELIIKLFPEAPEEINLSEPVFIIIDGYPVPFFFKYFEARGNNRALIVFDDMESMLLAEELVGEKLYIRQEAESGKQEAESGRQEAEGGRQLVNYKVEDEVAGNIGIVSDFMDIPNNPCLLITDSSACHEIIIPYREEFIVKIDHHTKIIAVRLPEGLINLNQPS